MKSDLDAPTALCFALLFLLVGMALGAGVRDCQHGGAPIESTRGAHD